MADRVTITRDGGVAHVELSRPDKLNALDSAMFEALIAAGDTLKDDPSLRAVVLSGQGRAFSAGLDVASFAAMMGEGNIVQQMLAPYPGSPANHAQQPAWTWRQLPVPVIAAIHGSCFGGGLQIALGADIRIVTPDAKLSVMEIKWGLIPDMTGTQTLRDLLPLDVAKELTFTGRIFDGNEAKALGLATSVSSDPRAAALAMAHTIAEKSPDAIRVAKRLLDESRHVDPGTGLALEAKLQSLLLGSHNQLEAVMANMQKRAPAFADPEL
jgi:enoyl-CoA hydratase/carnithine racemase